MNSRLTTSRETAPLKIRLHPSMKMSDDQFFDFCQLNQDVLIERNCQGELIFMSPTSAEGEERNFNLVGQLWFWTKKNGTGVGFGSSGGFTLPNGAVRSSDAAWIEKERWLKTDPDLRKRFAPICPNFVVELRSQTDSLQILQEKMQEYIDNGAKLGWLIDPIQQKVYIYQPHTNVEELDHPQSIDGGNILPEFILELQDLGF